MVKSKTLLSYLFKLILLMTFLLGGFIQYVLGVPNTFYTILILGFIFFAYTLSLLIRKGKLTSSSIAVTCFCYILLIIISGIFNQNEIAKTLLYFIFPIIPLAVFILINGMIKNEIDIK